MFVINMHPDPEKGIDCPDSACQPRSGFVAVHAGAGYHSVTHEAEYKEACKAACIKAMKAIKRGLPAVEVVTMAISSLEDCPCTNAGVGSNLSRSGRVECDASIMDGESLGFGSVGTIKGIRNPIQVACKVLQEELKGPSTSGLIPPIFLAGEGAFQWAVEHGCLECPERDMITDRSMQTWKKCVLRLQQSSLPTESACGSNKRCRLEDLCNVFNESSETMDTVGAVCMDASGHLCAGVSSGGVVYKTPGRIGQAAVYGSGCWATRIRENRVGVACCTSGCGEHLIKTMLARECANEALSSDAVTAVHETLVTKFLGSSSLSSVGQKLGGVLLLRVEGDKSDTHPGDCTIDLVWGHTTDSMCVGYMTVQDKNPKVRLTRMEKGTVQPLLVEGVVHRTPNP